MYQAISGVKIFPFTGGGGGSLGKIFFPSLNMYQAKSGVKKFSLYWGGGGGGSLNKNFFSQSEHVSSQIWCQKFFPLLRPGPPRPETRYPPPPPEPGPGTPPPGPGPGTPPTWTWTWDPPYLDLGPLPPVDRHTDRCQNITFPSYYVCGQ